MQQVRGSVVHCSRFGCVVRLDDGRLAMLPASDRGIDRVRRAVVSGRHPQFPFVVAQEDGRRVRLALAAADAREAVKSGDGIAADTSAPVLAPEAQRFSASLEQKIIDFWRQASEWDRSAGRVDEEEPPLRRADRLRPFDERAPRQYRDIKKRPRRRR
ncbi:MAG: hypothetical protein JOY87_02845 [Candidatus Eremiobacteraeota bacterium]|nr:hypothetical protein [Candidatus Eremiobacteraeota bacterium]